MTRRRIVLDANILIRAVLGKHVGRLLIEFSGTVDFCTPTVAFDDAQAHLPRIMAKHGIAPETSFLGIEAVRGLVKEIPAEITDPLRKEALIRIGGRDPDDWPIIAAALALGCPIWTEDKDFFGTGLPVWTSDLIEVYLQADSL